jgi:ankyrin repeat protein
MFTPDDQHLRLLLEVGLGSGDGGPWRRLLGEALDCPADLLVQQLAWAIDHRFSGRVRLLVRHGADVHRPLPSWPCSDLAGLLPVAAAWRAGSADIAHILTRAGAEPIDPTGEQRAMAELLAGRAAGTASAAAVAALRAAQPDLVHRADSPGAVRAVLDAGFAVDARRNGATALHWAAWRGQQELVRALLRAGADPAVTDAEHGATPLEWAEHARQAATMALLQDIE